MFELAVKIKGDSKTFTHKHLIYDEVTLSKDDKLLNRIVEESCREFGENKPIEDVSLTFKMSW